MVEFMTFYPFVIAGETNSKRLRPRHGRPPPLLFFTPPFGILKRIAVDATPNRTKEIIMAQRSADELRHCFETSKNPNELFDAFEEAIALRIGEFQYYRSLFWNFALTADELCLFADKLAKEFPALGYEVFIWLAHIFAIMRSSNDNFELAMIYFQKSAAIQPDNLEPYLDAADCYNSDINIPPVKTLIDFLKSGIEHIAEPRALYERLAYLYEMCDNDEMRDYFRRKAGDENLPPSDTEE